MDWIRITERLPLIGDEILLALWSDNEWTILAGRLTSDGWHSIPDDEDRFDWDALTHWMPMPAMPSGEPPNRH